MSNKGIFEHVSGESIFLREDQRVFDLRALIGVADNDELLVRCPLMLVRMQYRRTSIHDVAVTLSQRDDDTFKRLFPIVYDSLPDSGLRIGEGIDYERLNGLLDQGYFFYCLREDQAGRIDLKRI